MMLSAWYVSSTVAAADARDERHRAATWAASGASSRARNVVSAETA